MFKNGNFLKTGNSYLHCITHLELLKSSLKIIIKYRVFSFEKRERWLIEKCRSYMRYVDSSELIMFDLPLSEIRVMMLNKFKMELTK